MRTNVGQTKIRTRIKSSNSLKQFDCLPKFLREWLRNAALPWRPSSVHRAYKRALSRSGEHRLAMVELERLQEYQLAKDRLF